MESIKPAKGKKVEITCESPLRGAICRILEELPGRYRVVVTDGPYKGERTTVQFEHCKIVTVEEESDESEPRS